MASVDTTVPFSSQFLTMVSKATKVVSKTASRVAKAANNDTKTATGVVDWFPMSFFHSVFKHTLLNYDLFTPCLRLPPLHWRLYVALRVSLVTNVAM